MFIIVIYNYNGWITTINCYFVNWTSCVCTRHIIGLLWLILRVDVWHNSSFYDQKLLFFIKVIKYWTRACMSTTQLDITCQVLIYRWDGGLSRCMSERYSAKHRVVYIERTPFHRYPIDSWPCWLNWPVWTYPVTRITVMWRRDPLPPPRSHLIQRLVNNLDVPSNWLVSVIRGASQVLYKGDTTVFSHQRRVQSNL